MAEMTEECALAERLCQKWGEFLQNLAPWTWYGHFTFRKDTHPEAASKTWGRFTHQLNRKALGCKYWRRSEGIRWARATEWQKRGTLHYHAFIADVEGVNQFQWMERWNELAGFARIYPYEPERGAAWYISKYATKEAIGGEIDIGGTFDPLLPRMRR